MSPYQIRARSCYIPVGFRPSQRSIHPGLDAVRKFYIAKTAGTYVNFDNIEVDKNHIVALSNKDGLWKKYILDDNNVSINEVYDRYDVIDKQGEIWTLREKIEK